MGTKWLSRNRRLVLACLSITDEPDADESDEELEQDDLDALGLKALPVHVNVILADPADRARVGGLRHLSAPLPEVDALPVQPEAVLIVENKESAYLFPTGPEPWWSTRLATTSMSWTRSAGCKARTSCTGATSTEPGSPCCRGPVPDCQALSPSSWTRKRSKRIEPSPSRTRHELTLRIRTSPTSKPPPWPHCLQKTTLTFAWSRNASHRHSFSAD